MVLFLWDNKKEEEQLAQITRDETLSRLPLRLSTNRIVELVQLRDTVRPVSVHHILSFSMPSILGRRNFFCLTNRSPTENLYDLSI